VIADASTIERIDFSDCTFRKAGFRTYELSNGTWRLVLSRVDTADREPRGLLSVFAPGNPRAFGELGDLILSRSIGLYGGTNQKRVIDELGERLGGDLHQWARRIDYLAARTIRETQAGSAGVVVLTGRPERPEPMPQAIAGILPVGRTISLYGPGSAGKTTLADGLIVSLRSGVEVVPGWLPTRRFVVGLLDWDEGEEEERARLYAIGNAYPYELTPFHYRRMSRPLADAADEVGRWAAENGLEVLIVSPANRALRPANGDPGQPVFDLYEVLREFGTTNLIIDHVTGANIDNPEASREYGSVAKRDASRGSFSLYAQSEEPGSRTVVIRNAKPLAMYPRRAPQAVRIDYEPPYPDLAGLYESIRFSPAEVIERGAPKAESQPERLVRLLREHGPANATRLAALGGFDARQVRKIVDKARSAGYAVQCDRSSGVYSLSVVEEVD
jgi:hypothetical protein